MEAILAILYIIVSTLATLVWYLFLFCIGVLLVIAAVVSILGLIYDVKERR